MGRPDDPIAPPTLTEVQRLTAENLRLKVQLTDLNHRANGLELRWRQAAFVAGLEFDSTTHTFDWTTLTIRAVPPPLPKPPVGA